MRGSDIRPPAWQCLWLNLLSFKLKVSFMDLSIHIRGVSGKKVITCFPLQFKLDLYMSVTVFKKSTRLKSKSHLLNR